MASAKKLPSGSWRVNACKTINGKKIHKSFTVSPNDYAGDWRAAKKQAELLANNWALEKEEEKHIITVKKALYEFLDFKKESLSPSTYKDYLNMPQYFESIFDKDINDIDDDIIQSFIDTYSKNGLSPKTSKNRIGFLKSALKRVYKKTKINKVFDYTIPEAVPPDLKPPEPSQFHKLLSIASDEEKLIIILAGLYTLRRGEIGGLYGEDIMRDDNKIYVHTSLVKNEKKEWYRKPIPKKSHSVRYINIDPEIMKMFPDVASNEPLIKITPDAMTHHFIKLRKKAGANCRLHDLRKYAASIRSEFMPYKYIEADGGWAKDSVVMKKVYDKPFQELREEYSQEFNKNIIKEYGKELFGT